VSSAAPTAADIRKAHRRLKRAFGPLDPPRRVDPIDELVFTVLSQNTSDRNTERSFASLRARFPTWEAVAEARPEEVADAIRSGGLSNIKAPRIIAILREIARREGTIDLSWMHEADDEAVRSYLRTLPGVGPKTAACVLAFSLDRPALPVDTHVHRVATRLGYLPPRASAEVAHRVLEDLVPPGLRVQMHVGLIRLGREVCKSGRPRCEVCPLQDVCPTAPLFLAAGER
jgi:endonuclease III